jgi:hypothetical protein
MHGVTHLGFNQVESILGEVLKALVNRDSERWSVRHKLLKSRDSLRESGDELDILDPKAQVLGHAMIRLLTSRELESNCVDMFGYRGYH